MWQHWYEMADMRKAHESCQSTPPSPLKIKPCPSQRLTRLLYWLNPLVFSCLILQEFQTLRVFAPKGKFAHTYSTTVSYCKTICAAHIWGVQDIAKLYWTENSAEVSRTNLGGQAQGNWKNCQFLPGHFFNRKTRLVRFPIGQNINRTIR